MSGPSSNEEKAMITIYRYLKRESGSEGEELYSVAHRSNRMILVEGNFRLGIRETLFSVIDTHPLWNGTPRELRVR